MVVHIGAESFCVQIFIAVWFHEVFEAFQKVEKFSFKKLAKPHFGYNFEWNFRYNYALMCSRLLQLNKFQAPGLNSHEKMMGCRAGSAVYTEEVIPWKKTRQQKMC